MTYDKKAGLVAIVLSVIAIIIANVAVSSANRNKPAQVREAVDYSAQIVELTTQVTAATAAANKAQQQIAALRTELLRDKITGYLMTRKVRDMKDEELVLLLRTERYEDAAEELGDRRIAALKAAGQKAQPRKQK